MHCRLIALSCLLTLSVLTAGDVRSLPDVRGQRLSDKEEATLDSMAAGRPRLLLLAFSSVGGEKVRSLAYSIREDYPVERLPFVHVVGLARVPSLFRGMAKRSLRKDIPEERHNYVLVIADEEQENLLRQAFRADDQDSAYVVGVDADGGVTGVVRAPEGRDASEVDALIARML